MPKGLNPLCDAKEIMIEIYIIFLVERDQKSPSNLIAYGVPTKWSFKDTKRMYIVENILNPSKISVPTVWGNQFW